MSDQPQPGTTPNPAPADAAPGGKTPIESLPPDIQEYIRSLRTENEKRRKAEDAAQETVRQAEAKRLEDEKKFEELAKRYKTELDALKPKADLYGQTIGDMLAKRIDAIPEAQRSIVPDFGDPLKTLQWLDANAALFAPRRAPNLDGGAGNGSGKPAAGSLTAEELRIAKQSGMTPEQYATSKAKIQARQQQET